MALLAQRWLVLEAKPDGAGRFLEPEPAGTVRGPRKPEDAVRTARRWKWGSVHRNSHLLAIRWEDASAEQRAAAAAEDEVRHHLDRANELSPYERDLLAGNLPIGMSTPGRAVVYQGAVRMWAWVKFGAVTFLLGMIARLLWLSLAS